MNRRSFLGIMGATVGQGCSVQKSRIAKQELEKKVVILGALEQEIRLLKTKLLSASNLSDGISSGQ